MFIAGPFLLYRNYDCQKVKNFTTSYKLDIIVVLHQTGGKSLEDQKRFSVVLDSDLGLEIN